MYDSAHYSNKCIKQDWLSPINLTLAAIMLIRRNFPSVGSGHLCMSEVLLSPCLDLECCYLLPSPRAAWVFCRMAQ